MSRECAAPVWGTGRRQQQDKENSRDYTTPITPVEGFLDRLDGVRERGDRQWISRCPSHEDREPSLSIRECTDGTVLIKCFAGCGAADVVEAVGLQLHDLFPPKTGQPGMPRGAPAIRAEDVLAMLHREVLIALLGAEDARDGLPLGDADHERLITAVKRIRGAAEYMRCTIKEELLWDSVDKAVDQLRVIQGG
ncbi:MAG: hypothetical protein ACREVK_12505 [Gammaproteobacteria bacterium]